MSATLLGAMVAARVRAPGRAFLAAFATYEGVQYAFALAAGGAENFSLGITAQIFVAHLVAGAILLALWLALARDREARVRATYR